MPSYARTGSRGVRTNKLPSTRTMPSHPSAGNRSPTTTTASTAATTVSMRERPVAVLARTRATPPEQDVACEHRHKRHIGPHREIGPGFKERPAGHGEHGHQQQSSQPEQAPMAARDGTPPLISR